MVDKQLPTNLNWWVEFAGFLVAIQDTSCQCPGGPPASGRSAPGRHLKVVLKVKDDQSSDDENPPYVYVRKSDLLSIEPVKWENHMALDPCLNLVWTCYKSYLGGGFKRFLFLSLPGEMIQFY